VACEHYGKLRSSNVNCGNSVLVGLGAPIPWTSVFDFSLILVHLVVGRCCGVEQELLVVQSLVRMAKYWEATFRG
jgi:hypothetical protein